MIIVEFSYHSNQRETKEQIMQSPSEVVYHAAKNTETHAGFNIIRINKYEKGQLIPMEIKVNKGRITLEPVPQEMDDTEARMRMISEAQSKIPGNAFDNNFEF